MTDSLKSSRPLFSSILSNQYFLNSIFFVLSFWVLNQVAYLYEVAENVSVFYPPSGFAMLLIYLFGAKYLPVYFIAIIIGGLPQRDVLNYGLDMLAPDLRQFFIYGTAGLLLRKKTFKEQVLDTRFFHFFILTSIATALFSSAIFIFKSLELNSLFSLERINSVASFFVGNLTGALMALPIFVFYIYFKSIGWRSLGSDIKQNILKPDKITALILLLFLSFLVISMGRFNEDFSNYYYFIVIPIIWTSVKWGLSIGLMYAFIGNIFTLIIYVIFGYSHYGVLELQVMFSMSIIANLLIGLVHEQRDLFYKDSMHDGLTGLANMRLFKLLSLSMIARAFRNKEENAILFIDIDGFKAINDSFGHKAGDDLLQHISQLIRICIRDSDAIARFGGDEFIIQLGGNTSAKDAENVALNIIESISNPFYFDKGPTSVGASIGIALYPRDGKDIETLISKADRAMYVAKKNGKSSYRLHSRL